MQATLTNRRPWTAHEGTRRAAHDLVEQLRIDIEDCFLLRGAPLLPTHIQQQPLQPFLNLDLISAFYILSLQQDELFQGKERSHQGP